MQIESTVLQDCYVLRPKVFNDDRGYFMETFNVRVFEQTTGLSGHFVQDNQSFSNYGVIRGLHMQVTPFDQAKLVRVIQGTIWDVAVDLREGSSTFGRWFGIELSGENRKQLYIPRGCLHGFSTLSSNAIVAYKTDNFYAANYEQGVHYSDSSLCIDWKIPRDEVLISERDQLLPFLNGKTC